MNCANPRPTRLLHLQMHQDEVDHQTMARLSYPLRDVQQVVVGIIKIYLLHYPLLLVYQARDLLSPHNSHLTNYQLVLKIESLNGQKDLHCHSGLLSSPIK